MYLAEALKRLQLQEFFFYLEKKEDCEFNELMDMLIIFKEDLETNETNDIGKKFESLKDKGFNLAELFNEFVKVSCSESELFKYWNNVLLLINLLFDLIRADRTGNWLLHLDTVEKLQPIFLIMDSTNYSRWSAVYLSDMQSLPQKAPEVFEHFMQGRFTVKRSNVPFTSVATDQALEQTINRTSKSSAGVIGSTRKKEFVALWDLTYHELSGINSLMKEIIHFDNNDEEFDNHHEASESFVLNSENAVQSILTCLEFYDANPFHQNDNQLRNIITQETVHESVKKDLLNIFERGLQIYENFVKERIQNKTKLLSSTITKNNLPNFKTTPTLEKDSKKVAAKPNDAQRIISSSVERGFPLSDLFKYELTIKNILFDDDESVKKTSNKCILVRKLEESVDNTQAFELGTDTCLMVDCMDVIKQVHIKNSSKIKTFGDLADKFYEHINNLAQLQTTKRIDLVFDSYFEFSIKSCDSERRKKADNSINYNMINKTIHLPPKMDIFWESSNNKIQLQIFLRYCVKQNSLYRDFDVVFSTINEQHNSDDFTKLIIDRDIEDADVKTIIHVDDAVKRGFSNVFVASSNSDVIVLLLHFYKHFQNSGVKVRFFSNTY
uniref:Uncharacterized protein n=1 Tax=Trichogramma kaykai TaxID=54128 RepID=A0ABD2X8Y1_9HYME